MIDTRLQNLNSNVEIVHSIYGEDLNETLWGLSALHEKSTKTQALDWTIGKHPKFEPLSNLSGFSQPRNYFYQHQVMTLELALLLLF